MIKKVSKNLHLTEEERRLVSEGKMQARLPKADWVNKMQKESLARKTLKRMGYAYP